MAGKKCKTKSKPSRRRYQNGGRFGEFAKNYGRALADVPLGAIGLDNVISDDAYTGTGGNFFRGYTNTFAPIQQAAGAASLNALAPGAGTATFDATGSVNNQIGQQQAGDEQQALQQQQAFIASKNQQLQQQPQLFRNGGQLTEFEGNKHEQGGIPIGQLNEVEDGETKFGDFIFSDSLKNSRTGNTFAEDSKRIKKKFGMRTNDPISQNTIQEELGKLSTAQEELKDRKFNSSLTRLSKNFPDRFNQTSEGQLRNGGRIKYNNGGTFRNNPYEYNSLAQFNTSDPGSIPQFNTDSNLGLDSRKAENLQLNPIAGSDELSQSSTVIQNKGIDVYGNTILDVNDLNPIQQVAQGRGQFGNLFNPDSSGSNRSINRSINPSANNDNSLGNITGNQALNFGLANAGDLFDIGRGIHRSLNPSEVPNRLVSAPTSQANLVDAAPVRQQVSNTFSGLNQDIRRSSSGAGNFAANRIASAVGEAQGLSQAQTGVNQANANILNQVDQFNNQIRQRAGMFNAGQLTNADTARQQERDIASNTIQSGLAGLGQSFAVSQRDARLDQIQQDIISSGLLDSPDYSAVVDNNGRIIGVRSRITGELITQPNSQ